MRLVRHVRLTDVLEEWGRHEAQGRLAADPSARAMLADLLPLVSSGGAEARLAAIETILWVRSMVVAHLLAARPVDCRRVAIDANDRDRLYVMSRHDEPELALAARAEELLGVANSDGDHVRRLASATDHITPPLLAVARTDLAKLTLLDGIHRGVVPPSAWWSAVRRRGERDRYRVTLVLRGEGGVMRAARERPVREHWLAVSSIGVGGQGRERVRRGYRGARRSPPGRRRVRRHPPSCESTRAQVAAARCPPGGPLEASASRRCAGHRAASTSRKNTPRAAARPRHPRHGVRSLVGGWPCARCRDRAARLRPPPHGRSPGRAGNRL